jgi:signal transduction histidine kinase
MFSSVIWTVGVAVEFGFHDLSHCYLATVIQYPGIATLPTFLLIFMLRYLGYTQITKKRTVALLMVMPIANFIFMFTNWLGLHKLMYADVRMAMLPIGVPMFQVVYGPLMWVFICYQYAVMILIIFLAVKAIMISLEYYRKYLWVFIGVIIIPFAVNIAYTLHLPPFYYFDMTPFTFGIFVIAIGWGMLRIQFHMIKPVSWQMVDEKYLDGIVILNSHMQIVKVNPLALQLLGCSEDDLIKKGWENSAPAWMLYQKNDDYPPAQQIEVGNRLYRVTYFAMKPDNGMMIVIRDITAEWKLGEERARQSMLKYLHDEIGQSLTACQLHLASLSSKITDPDQVKKLNLLEKSLGSTHQQLRSLTLDLMAPVDINKGLVNMLKWLADYMTRTFNIQIKVDSKYDAMVNDLQLFNLIFRGTREFLFNAIKHAVADSIVVHLEQVDVEFHIVVLDNGKQPLSVNVETGREHAGYGLPSLRTAIAEYGGRIELESLPQFGTRAAMVLPISLINHISEEI